MSTKLTTKKGSRTAAADFTKPAAGKKAGAKKAAKPKANDAVEVGTTHDDAAKSDSKKKPARAPKTKPESAKKVSQIDATLKVLGESTEPMNTKQMVEQMAAKGYWSSPGGKTPSATLYSAILRELQTKGDESRFVKTDRGQFRLRTA